ncbi:MAG TPA: DUF6516 family protein [Fibrella sp.]
MQWASTIPGTSAGFFRKKKGSPPVAFGFRSNQRTYAREYVNLKQVRKYAYQWQQADATLLIRWDNAPHHAYLTTYPYHQHIGNEETIQPSTAMTLDMVLGFIQAQVTDLPPTPPLP